jgi:hypothetical protein
MSYVALIKAVYLVNPQLYPKYDEIIKVIPYIYAFAQNRS